MLEPELFLDLTDSQYSGEKLLFILIVFITVVAVTADSPLAESCSEPGDLVLTKIDPLFGVKSENFCGNFISLLEERTDEVSDCSVFA